MSKIVSDVDGCLLRFLEPFAKWYNANFEDKIYNQHKQDYDLGKGDDDKFYPRIKQFWETPIFGNLPLMDKDAPKYFNMMARKNIMVIATAVDLKHADRRKKNLKDFKYDEIYFVPHNKEKFIINELKPDIAIEDKPELIIALAKAGIKVFYPELKYTIGMARYGTMYKNWKELYGYIAV